MSEKDQNDPWKVRFDALANDVRTDASALERTTARLRGVTRGIDLSALDMHVRHMREAVNRAETLMPLDSQNIDYGKCPTCGGDGGLTDELSGQPLICGDCGGTGEAGR